MNAGNTSFTKLEVRALPDKGGFGVYAIELWPPEKWCPCGAAISSTWNNWAHCRTTSSSIRCRLKRACISHHRRRGKRLTSSIHSCDPTWGGAADQRWWPCRDIEVGEEVCFGLSMTDCTLTTNLNAAADRLLPWALVRATTGIAGTVGSTRAISRPPAAPHRIGWRQEQGLVIVPLVSAPAGGGRLTPREVLARSAAAALIFASSVEKWNSPDSR